MFHLRPLEPGDRERLKFLYKKQGFDYVLPTDFIEALVVASESGEAVMAVGARPVAELYLLVDKDWATPRWRWEAFQALHEAMRQKLAEKGIEEMMAWVPPELDKSFGRRLSKCLAWFQPLWKCYARRTA